VANVCIFLTDLSGGGAERVMLNLANGFVERGHAVDLVLVNPEGPYLSQLSPQVRLVCLEAGRLLNSLPALMRYLRQHQPDVLLSALEDTNLVALWAVRLARVATRVIVTVHNNLSREVKNATSWKRRFVPRLVPWFYPWAAAVVAVSQGVAEDLARLGVGRDRIHVIYNPVVTPDLLPQSVQPVPHPWFQPGGAPVILGVGRLDRQKDFPTLIRAFAIARQQRPLKLVILGEGPERATLEGLVEQFGISQDVALPGFVDNPYAHMAKASLCVLSSAWEGFGNVLVESMAVGVPVVSTDCDSGPAEILANGRYGRLVPIHQAEPLAAAMLQTLDEPPNRDNLKHRALHFSLENSVASYLQLLTNLHAICKSYKPDIASPHAPQSHAVKH
jgi:glycosyltransferase involved in cell wall biosynthesis